MEPTNGLSGARIALLVDFDNVVLGLEDPGFDIELVVNALRERGTIVLGRVYGDWYRHNRHRRKLMEQGLELVETPAFGPVIKNSADIRIALDGFEIGLTQSHIDTFAIVSGDSDFLPLIKKLQALGRRVLVICGNRFTSDMLRRNCNEFISYENLLAQSVGAAEDATTLEGAFSLLHRAMAALRERGSEIRGSGVKQMMLQLNPVFSERTFGCTQFRQFLNKAVASGVVKLGPRDKFSGEFSVLLPDEDETPVQQKVERRNENRTRRDDKIAQIAARIEAVPVDDDLGVEVELDATADAIDETESDYDVVFEEGGAVFADDAFGFEPESMADAQTNSVQEIAQNVIARSELLARGLRPSQRRFSGRNGRPILDVPFEDEDAQPLEPESEAPEAAFQAPEPEAQPSATEAEAEASAAPAEENRRLRSRRRRRSASGQITVVAEDATLEGASATPDDNAEVAPDEDEPKIQISHEPLNAEEETRVDSAEAIEAPARAVADIQSALDEMTTPPVEPLSESKGVEVEAIAPALPEENAQIDAANPAGVPAKANADAKPKRRRPPRSKTKAAAPEAEVEAAPEVAATVETATVEPVVAPPTPVEAAVEPSAEAQAQEVPATEEAPAKQRRRRPSRAKKTKAAPAE